MKYIIRFSTLYIFDQIESDLSKWIRMDQIGSKWIKTDQTWSNWISDEIIIEIYHQIFNFIYFLIRLNQICQNESEWIKLDQNGSNLIKLDFWWNNHWNTSSDFQHYLFFDQNESNLSKLDQNGSNLIKFDFWWNNHWNISSDFQF